MKIMFIFLATVIPRRENLQVISVTQLEKDAILVCYESKFKNLFYFFFLTMTF